MVNNDFSKEINEVWRLIIKILMFPGHYGMNDYIDEESLQYLKIMEGNIYTANVVVVLPKGKLLQFHSELINCYSKIYCRIALSGKVG